MIYGGPEQPCRGEDWLAEIRAREGRPCPRVDLDPANEPAAAMLRLLLHEKMAPLAMSYFEALAEDMDRWERLWFISRLASTVADPTVMQFLYPPADGTGGE